MWPDYGRHFQPQPDCNRAGLIFLLTTSDVGRLKAAALAFASPRRRLWLSVISAQDRLMVLTADC